VLGGKTMNLNEIKVGQVIKFVVYGVFFVAEVKELKICDSGPRKGEPGFLASWYYVFDEPSVKGEEGIFINPRNITIL
jgi:hypothetical protein